MKNPDKKNIPAELWRYLQTRFNHKTLKALYSKTYKPGGKREVERHTKFFQKYGHN